MAAVGHAEVHGVRPQWRVGQRRRDGGVVQEGLLLHHGELVVASDAQVGRTDSHDGVVGDVGELLGDDPHAGHFLGPVVDGGVRPEALLIVVPDINNNKWHKWQSEEQVVAHSRLSSNQILSHLDR